jgi:CRP-like cAMP-binding protein
MEKNILLETLAGIRFLRGTSREHLDQIASVSDIRDFEAFDILFRDGDVADSVYLVVFGKLMLEVCTPEWGCKQIVEVGPGEMLGWSALSQLPHIAATARVLEKTRLVRIDAAKLLAICDEDPQFGYEFMHRALLALAKRLTATWTQLAQVHLVHYLPTTASAGER